MSVTRTMVKFAGLVVCVFAAGCSGESQAPGFDQAGAAGLAEAGAPSGEAGSEDPGVAGSSGSAEAGSAGFVAVAGGTVSVAGSSAGGAGGMPAAGGGGAVGSVAGGGTGGSVVEGGSAGAAVGGSSAGLGGGAGVGGSAGAAVAGGGAGGSVEGGSAGAAVGGSSTGGAGGTPGVACPYHTSTEAISSSGHRLTFTWTTYQIVLAVDLTSLAGYSVIPYVDGVQSAKAFPTNGMYEIPPVNRMKSFALEILPNNQTPVMPAGGLDLYCKT